MSQRALRTGFDTSQPKRLHLNNFLFGPWSASWKDILRVLSRPKIKDHNIGEQPLPLDTVIVNARVQARLSAIDTRAKVVPPRATRKQRNAPSLDST
jgi:hypothetical protein